MRLLDSTELDLVSGGKFDARPDTKPTGPLNGNGKAIGWCWGYGNLKTGENKHGVRDGAGCGCGGDDTDPELS